MLGDLMGNMEEKQKAMQEQLAAIQIQEEQGGVTITGNAAKEITNIEIDSKLLDADRKEELEDLMLVCMNNLMAKIQEEETKASSSMINDLLPPGMEGIFGL